MRQDQLELQEKVNEALEVELKNARARYGDKFADFSIMHNALEREIDEAEKEIVSMLYELKQLKTSTLSKENEMLEKIKEHAIKCAMEAIQVACVCEKYLQVEECQS